MPKAGNSRKRKKEGSKNEKPKGKSKKTKLEDGGDLEEQSKSADVPCKGEKDVTDIDEILEKNAAKNNLTAINVKSIIHHVVTDKRVLALVQSAMAEADSEESRVSSESVTDNVADVELDFAPLMTRAKSKQTAQGDPIAVLASQSPIKELRTKHTESSERKCKKINFTELELPESSSDEEYNPDEEEERSDEDTESCVSFTSDLASPQVPGTPEHHKPDVPNDPDDKTDQQEFAHTVTRSLSKKLCQEPFKVPYPVASTSLTQAPVEEISAGEGDLIAKRTRSQLPLLDTPIEIIEATFQPPDFTADMYDTIQEEDLDFDDIEWQKWLQGLINTDETFGEEDHEDTEYNFMAEDQKEEKEEYRNDRAVRIPQKEVNELMEELLKDYDGGLVDEIFFPDEDTSDMVYVEVISESPVVKEDVKLFNSRQLEQLSEQLQQHTQLLTQICVLAQEEPSLSHVAEISRDYVNELKGFHDRASNAELIRGLGDGVVHASAFTYQGLDQAVQIVNSKFDSKRRTPNPRKSVSPRKDKSPPKRIKRTKNPHEELLPPLSQTSIQLMATSTNVFRFTELLPHCNLLPKTGDTPKLLKGLRVKFSEAEDNLLALGLQEFDKQWDLIQQHLLPVKSAKQLQIRCKNLLSNRASENIIKFYRRNKQLWELPTITESVGRRLRGRDLVEPEWLMNYKKKQKETREVEEKRETLVTQQNAEGAAFGRPIAPKLGRACAVALQSGTAVGEQVAWVTITSPGRSWTAVTTPPPICEEKDASRDHKTTTITQITTTTQPCPVSSVCEESTSISPTKETEPPLIELPAEDMAVESGENSVTLQTEVELAGQSQESSTRETNLAPACKDPVPSTTSETDKENHTEDTADKPAPDTAANKPTSTAKTKPLRDKPVVGVSGGRVTSRSHCTVTDGSGTASVTSRKPAPNSQTSSVGNYVLEPDPKFRVRAHAFAENFLAKVKKELKDDPGTYEEFLQTLSMSSSEQCSPVELYRRVEVVLAQYPDLVEDFVGFLEPHQAVEAGVFMENLEFVRARTFLRRLEVHFQKSPSHFRKIMNAFDSWNKSASKDPLELQQAIVPMLKGQQHLIEELFSFFDDMKPPTCSDDDFEEVEFGSGSEPEVDDFEDVVIPCFVEPKKIKGRPAKGAQKPGGKNLPAGKPNTARKPATNVKGTKQQGTASKPAVNKTKKSSNTGKDLTSESRKNTEEQCKDLDNKAKRTRCRTHPDTSTIVENAGGDDGHDIHKTELSASDGPLSVAASLQSETSNDSCRGEEFIPITTDTLNLELEEQDHRSSDSEEQEDDVNTDVENSPRDDGYEEDDDDYDDVDAAEYPEDFAGCDVDSDVTGGDVNIDVIASDADADVTGCDSDANMLSSEGVVPAKNLHRSEDGQLVLVWTREDDREILQACQKMGAKKETFRHVAITLQDKTVDEVEKRFVDLMNLFKASSGERTRESTNEETGSEDEDEEDSETIGESEGE